jgi:hypothetical protein
VKGHGFRPVGCNLGLLKNVSSGIQEEKRDQHDEEDWVERMTNYKAQMIKPGG